MSCIWQHRPSNHSLQAVIQTTKMSRQLKKRKHSHRLPFNLSFISTIHAGNYEKYRRKTRCPVPGCKSNFKKLPNHLSQVHKIINPKERGKLLEMARKYGGPEVQPVAGSAKTSENLRGQLPGWNWNPPGIRPETDMLAGILTNPSIHY